MKLTYILGIAFVAALAKAAPAANDQIQVVTANYLLGRNLIYTAKHDIVSLMVPHNGVNKESDFKYNYDYSKLYVFFVEADVNKHGEKEYKGLYLLKDNKATKILETGTDSATDNSNSKNVFISATDGLYVYNSDSGKVERYGSITDNLISVVKLNSSDVLYVLTADNFVYKVTDNGEKKVKVDDIKDAKQIVLDYSDNLYYYGAEKQPYVLTEGEVKKIDGVPANPKSVALSKSLMGLGDSVTFSADDSLYIIRVDKTSKLDKLIVQAKPSAMAIDGGLIDYFAYEKKIFRLNK